MGKETNDRPSPTEEMERLAMQLSLAQASAGDAEIHEGGLMRDYTRDPLGFISLCWPELRLYPRQAEVLQSLVDNTETFVPAANETGKSLIASLSALWFFQTRSPARVVIISATEKNLKNVIWREMSHRIGTSKLMFPVTMNTERVDKWLDPQGKKFDARSFIIGQVTNQPDSFQGHHLPHDIPRVLLIAEEASGIEDIYYEAATAWRHRMLVIGNPLNTTNFFYFKSRVGDVQDPSGNDKLLRKVIHISAEDTPNVIVGHKWTEAGMEGQPPVVIEGLLAWHEYLTRKHEYDEPVAYPRLYGRFYTGAQAMLFPEEWLDRSINRAKRFLDEGIKREACAMGIDTGAGRDETVWTIIDKLGIIKQIGTKTPDTSKIIDGTIELMTEYGISPWQICIDYGGGGKQIADMMQRLGYRIHRIHFGASASKTSSTKSKNLREDNRVNQQAYKNKRAEMYGRLRTWLRPDREEGQFALLPRHAHGCGMLEEELRVVPMTFDAEGKMYVVPKDKSPTAGINSDTITLKKLLGRSPDRADSLVLALEALSNQRVMGGVLHITDDRELEGRLRDTKEKFSTGIEGRMAELFGRMRSGFSGGTGDRQ